MKYLLLLFLVAGCTAPIEFSRDELAPFQTAIAPNGARTWSFLVTPLVRDYWPEKSDQQLLAETMAAANFCGAGYAVENAVERDDATVYSGRCR